MKPLTTRIVGFALTIVLVGVSIVLGEFGFGKILEFRMLERIPAGDIADANGGEAQFRGTAKAMNRTLTTPKTGTTSLYYRYVIEEERRDSDGNKSWHTIRDENDSVDFILVDNSAQAQLATGQDRQQVRWSVRQRFKKREGRLRHTEWRIEPGDALTVFGWFEMRPSPRVDFSTPGQYVPILSAYSGRAERAGLGVAALLLLWGSVTTMVFGCFAFTFGLRIHRTLFFLVIITVATSFLLIHYGFRSLEHDVRDGRARVDSQMARTADLLEPLLTRYGVPFSWTSAPALAELQGAGLPAEAIRQHDAWRTGTFLVLSRYYGQIDRFPESLAADLLGTNDVDIDIPEHLSRNVAEKIAAFESTRVSGGTWAMALTFGGLLLTAVIAYIAFRFIRTKRLQENLPTSKTAGVVFGLVEVEGSLVPENPDEVFKGPVSDRPCTWYHYKIEERRGTGKNAKWVTVHDETKKQPFFCEDDEGRIRVFPGQAEIITRHSSSRRSGNRSYSEKRLEPDDELYVLAKARLDRTRGASLVLGHEKGTPYIIANVPEADIMYRKAMSGFALLSVGVSLLFLCMIWIGGAGGQFSSLDFLLASLVAPTFLSFMVLILMYNDLVFLYQRCERNFSNIQVSLKKRANLIPRLEQVVKRYLAHERELQTELAELRQAIRAADSAREIDSYLAKEHESIDMINARMEAYPELDGSEVVADLTRRLIKLENEVALIRAGFNDAVNIYKTRCESFPDNIIAFCVYARLPDTGRTTRRTGSVL